MIKKVLLLLLIFGTNLLVNASTQSDLKLVSINPKMEELQFVDSYPFYEGQKLAEEPAKKVKKPIVYTKEELKYIEELRQISMEEFDKADDERKQTTLPSTNIKKSSELIETSDEIKKVENIDKLESTKIKKPITHIIEKEEPKVQRIEKYDEIENIEKKTSKKVVENRDFKKENPTNFLSNVASYEQILIEVDSVSNLMTVKAKVDNQLKDLKTYKVSTGKNDVKKPFGDGKVSKISLNPIWYPTADTIKSFKKRGINLPSIVLPGDKYNYMGAAKINLTHEVDGKNTFRIHGTLNEKTIGTNESAGCIRMKNGEVLQLATFLNQFANLKSLNDVKVMLK